MLTGVKYLVYTLCIFTKGSQMTERKTDNITVKWDDEDERLASLVVEKFAAEMGVMGIPTRSATRKGGKETFNRSGAIKFALRKLLQEYSDLQIANGIIERYQSLVGDLEQATTLKVFVDRLNKQQSDA
jgi:hypothetical protein